MNPEIIPAIMPESYEEIDSLVRAVRHSVQTVQIDILDGVYVRKKTWPITAMTDLKLFGTGDLGFPLWDQMNYELDLMVARPEENLAEWLSMGASRVIIHYASVHNWELIKNIDQITRNFLELGLAVTVHDDLEKIYELLDNHTVDFIQCMGISSVGYQGEPFEPKILEVINTLKERYPDLLISVDGGVSTDTIAPLYSAGARRFVSGSGVYGYGDPNENIEHLYGLLEE